MQVEIEFTDAAAKKVQGLINEEENPNLNLRAYVVGGGCSGFQYGFTFDEQVKDNDFVLEKKLQREKTSDADAQVIKLLIDQMSYQYLRGATIDYREDVNGSQFVIKNPNAKTTCGCGNSFDVE